MKRGGEPEELRWPRTPLLGLVENPRPHPQYYAAPGIDLGAFHPVNRAGRSVSGCAVFAAMVKTVHFVNLDHLNTTAIGVEETVSLTGDFLPVRDRSHRARPQ